MGFSMEDDIKQQQERSALPMLWIGIVSIVMLFAGFTSAAIVSHMSGSWIHIKLPTIQVRKLMLLPQISMLLV